MSFAKTLLELVFDAIIRSLPAVVSLFFCAFHFNRSLLINSLDANPDSCIAYDKIKDLPKKDRYSCLIIGTTSLSIISAASSLGLTIFINSYFSSDPLMNKLGLIFGFLLFCAIFLYIHDYKTDFRLGKNLMKSENKYLQFIGRKTGIAANIGSLLLSLIFYISLLFLENTT